MAAEWSCKANPRAIEPEDCGWPDCGCDPHAGRVMEGLVEAGWLTPNEAEALYAEGRALRALCGEAAAHYAGGGVFPVHGEMAERLRSASHPSSFQKNISNEERS